MNIYVTRHGQTNLNKLELMQGLTDEPLNDTGRAQAKKARANIGDMTFDAVYASPLDRAIETATIIGNVPRDQVIVDERIIEVDFGKYEKRPYKKLGKLMSLYWAIPEIFPCPDTVENVASMVKRTSAFLEELEQKDYENVLIVCHGGIIRAICGYLENKRNKIKWRPRPKNCEIRVYEANNKKYSFKKSYYIE